MTVRTIGDRPKESAKGPRAVLIGPMGSGKTTVGQALAARWDVPFVDADAFIESMTQMSVPQIFEQLGEDHFRRIEAAAVAHLLETHVGVVALGGGAPATAPVRDALRGHRVVRLRVDAASVRERLGSGAGRPLLAAEDPMAAWQRVAAERDGVYADVAMWEVQTDGRRPEAIAEHIAEHIAAGTEMPAPVQPESEADGRTRIHVGRSAAGYDIVIGRGILGDVVDALPELCTKVLIVHQLPLRERAEALQEAVRATGRAAFLAEIPDGEEAKTAQVLAFLWQIMGQTDMTRTDAVIGFGGGAATDLAGFAAATWLRGVEVVHVPTTVAGMVDAAVGGKTGINTAEGKNLVGAFHPPRAVIADLDVLDGLDAHDVAAGLAEAVKTGFIADTRILDIVEANPAAVLDTTTPAFAEVLERAIRVKASVVSEDLRESGLREILNYGHTLAHAIERNERYQWRHGAAVAVGMVFAAELSQLAGRLDAATVDRHRAILRALGLPVTYRDRQWPKLLETMRRDKKSRGAMLRFVVLDAIGRPSRLEGPDPALLLAAYDAITEDPELAGDAPAEGGR